MVAARVETTLAQSLEVCSARLAAVSAFVAFLVYSLAGATVGVSEGLLGGLITLVPEVKHNVLASSKNLFQNGAAVIQKNGKHLSAEAKPYIDSGKRHASKASNHTASKANHVANQVTAKAKHAVN
ncbi:hypothetical protein WJX72_005232 [[Myrmecia] bisecta]|uniref:Uncharacterized protein n=1 Tax=[Myrmecia] bisecta TaxID=41462 RepID=A0AAW1Q128_9CHLO